MRKPTDSDYFVLLLAGAFGVAEAYGFGVWLGVATFAVIAAPWLFLKRWRRDSVPLFDFDPGDERQSKIRAEAAALSHYLIITVALIGAIVEISHGRFGPYGVICAVGGGSQMLATLVLPRFR